jgi:hypothetical protein
MRTLARFTLAALAVLVVNRGVYGDSADQAYDRIVENWRWSHYWFGKTGIDDVYVEGKKISALIFWTKSDSQPIRGLCSTDLSLCVAYSGVYLDPLERRMQVAPNVTAQQAFESFVKSGLGDSSHILAVGGLRPADFQIEEKSVTLPAWVLPASISGHKTPAEAASESARLKRLLGCGAVSAETRPPRCSGTLVFAYYGATDPYWFVLRSCSTDCEFGGDAIEELTRGDRGWEVTSGGFINTPKAEVERLKQQIQKAEMLRLQL